MRAFLWKVAPEPSKQGTCIYRVNARLAVAGGGKGRRFACL